MTTTHCPLCGHKSTQGGSEPGQPHKLAEARSTRVPAPILGPAWIGPALMLTGLGALALMVILGS